MSRVQSAPRGARPNAVSSADTQWKTICTLMSSEGRLGIPGYLKTTVTHDPKGSLIFRHLRRQVPHPLRLSGSAAKGFIKAPSRAASRISGIPIKLNTVISGVLSMEEMEDSISDLHYPLTGNGTPLSSIGRDWRSWCSAVDQFLFSPNWRVIKASL